MSSSNALQTATAAIDTTQIPQMLPLHSDPSIPEPTLSGSQGISDVAEVEDSGLESSGSSMDESTSPSASSSMDQDSDSEPEQQAGEIPLEPSDAVLTQETLAHDVPPVEAPSAATFEPTNLTSMEALMDVDPAVEVRPAADGLNASRESSVLSDNYEPPEPENSDEAYSPKLSPKDIEESEIETAPKHTTPNDADVTLTRKPQDLVVIASKGDALDVR
jgi:hypothetical protein